MKSALISFVLVFSSSSSFAGDLTSWVGTYRSDCPQIQETIEITYQDGALQLGNIVTFSNINEGKQVSKMNTETGYIRSEIVTEFTDDDILTREESSVNYLMWVIPTERFKKGEILSLNADGTLEYVLLTGEDRGDEGRDETYCTLTRI
jgi:hypothetical protein